MPSVPTTSWDETSPAGSDALNQGDNRIRELKTQVRELIAVDHVFPSSGSATDNGQHKKVTLQEQADLGTGAVNATLLGSQTVSGKGELVYTDEDDNDIPLTKLGTPIAINNCTAKTTPSINDLLLLSDSADSYKSKKITISNILNAIYPVGIVVTLGVSTNPNTLFGIGTWTAIAGKVIVGIDAVQTEFDALDETGGSKTNSHTHGAGSYTNDTGTPGGDYSDGVQNVGGYMKNEGADTYASNTVKLAITGTSDVPSDTNNLPPYIVKYVWQRTA